MYTEDELIPISALQHVAFCERQAALIYTEGLWEENVRTVEGEDLHERAHSQEAETLSGIRIERSLRVRSLKLGLVGVTDVVEFRMTNNRGAVAMPHLGPGIWLPYIIEYKRGKPKLDRTDEVQLCAQAICLEEMLGVSMPESAFFYGLPRRRHNVLLDDNLRQETVVIANKARQLLLSGKTPPPEYGRRCKQCSLVDLCMPKTAGSQTKVTKYLQEIFNSYRQESGEQGEHQ